MNDVIDDPQLGYNFPFVLSVNLSTNLSIVWKKKERNVSSFSSSNCKRKETPSSFVSFLLPSGMISFHRGDPFQKVHSGPRSASSRCQRRIIGTLAGSRRREKRRWLALRRFAVRRSPYWGRSNFSPIGGRACEAWVRVAANSCARCPTVGPPHPRMSRAHEQLKYRTNSRSRTLVPVASILPSFLPFFLASDRSLVPFASSTLTRTYYRSLSLIRIISSMDR